MTTNRLQHIEPSSTDPMGRDTRKAVLWRVSAQINLDKWVRHRIRACYWKQWRKAGARARNLMKLGLSREVAVAISF